jgi:hypothetical protein
MLCLKEENEKVKSKVASFKILHHVYLFPYIHVMSSYFLLALNDYKIDLYF